MEKDKPDHETLFVWRNKKIIDPKDDQKFPNSDRKEHQEKCPFCLSLVTKKARKNGWEDYWQHICEYCGFKFLSQEVFGFGWHDRLTISYLKNFNINDQDITINEICSHLTKNYSIISSISPRRFEEIVASIYRDQGYYVRLTQQSRDGGYDLILLDGASGEQILVECKRYTNNKVSVHVARELVGVQVENNIKNAKIITTSHFTKPAKNYANNINTTTSEYSLDLIDADRLLNMMTVYNTKLPPLHLLNSNKTSY